MRNITVSTAGGALPEVVGLSRRSVFGGIAAAPALALPALAAQEPAPQKEIAQRLRELAGEMSELLAALDGGGWQVEVKPALAGTWRYELERVDLSARIRLDQGLTMARKALEELAPGQWRADHNVTMGFALIMNDGWNLARPDDLRGGLQQC